VGLSLELSFETRELREFCESAQKTKDQLGGKLADELKRLLADLRAASSIEELPVAKPLRLSDKCIFELSPRCRLTVTPNHRKIPLDQAGKLDWASIKRITITKIEHDND
jgi:hypothetical protein